MVKIIFNIKKCMYFLKRFNGCGYFWVVIFFLEEEFMNKCVLILI